MPASDSELDVLPELIENLMSNMKSNLMLLRSFIVLVALLFVGCDKPMLVESTTEKAPKNNVSDFSIGETLEFPSSVLMEDRKINVYLPLSYAKDVDRKYPAIYLLDGSADEDFIHVSGLVQFGSFSWIKMLPESIVVGIANVDRKRDFTYPSNNERDNKDVPTSGGSAKFIEMLETELQPLVEKSYRTNGTKTIIGQSFGGLVVTEILFKKSELFDNFIIISPSLWWDDESLLKLEPKDFLSSKSIYVGVGKEGEVMERVAKELYEKINHVKTADVEVDFQFFPELDHGDTLHIALYDAFKKMFQESETEPSQ